MSRKVIIVGALPGDPPYEDLLMSLQARDATIAWEWLRATEVTAQIAKKIVNRVIHSLQQPTTVETTIVKLRILDHGIASKFYGLKHHRPVPAPTTVQSVEELVNWIFSDDANLVPRKHWNVNVREAALLALLSKLLRKKYWNSDVSGHKWLKETALLNQTPVHLAGLSDVRKSARTLLPKLIRAGLLLTKGSGQGNTPREYSINTEFLPVIRKSITDKAFKVLASKSELRSLVTSVITSSSLRNINAMDTIINSTTLENCRDVHAIEND